MAGSTGQSQHPQFSRRSALQAGSVGLLGLSSDQLSMLRDANAAPANRPITAKSVIYVFLSGGLGQHDSFDMKPDAPDLIRGEFQPISTATPGLQICEHLPLLAEQSVVVIGPFFDAHAKRTSQSAHDHAQWTHTASARIQEA